MNGRPYQFNGGFWGGSIINYNIFLPLTLFVVKIESLVAQAHGDAPVGVHADRFPPSPAGGAFSDQV